MASSNQGKQGNQGSQSNQGGSNRGFASMDPQRQREIAAEGGRAAHASGNAHEFTAEEAREAGRHSHDNDGGSRGGSQSGGRGSAQDEDSGMQGHGSRGSGQGTGMRGGTPEQHAAAGRQSHKNDR